MKKGDVGPVLAFTITSTGSTGGVVDLSAATTALLRYQFGNSTCRERTMTFFNATAGEVRYTLQPGDLPSTGIYKFEVYIEWSDGDRVTSSRVFEIIEPTLCG